MGWDGGLVLEPPRTPRWDFGGHPYGLEPLTLPVDTLGAPVEDATDVRPLLAEAADVAGTGLADVAGTGLADVAGTGLADVAADVLPRPDPVERLFWFRWITGHQVTFVMWQMLARAAVEIPDGGEARAAAARRAARLVRGYSTMLLYTGSCPRDIYHRVIRPSMALRHPAFSGAWAHDYAPIRPLLRGRVPVSWGPDAAILAAECELNTRIHEGIAEKLVPGSPSLLQESLGYRQIEWRRGVLEVLFDTYFLTLRAPLTVAVVLLQFIRRVRAIERDLAANGLYPGYAPSRHEKPWALRRDDVDGCEQDLPTILSDVAGEAIRSEIKRMPIRSAP